MLDQAIARATSYLLGARNAQGWWEDFLLAPGHSDEWVTAYVGLALAAVDHPRARAAAQAAWQLLETRCRPDDRWGYNGGTPGDGDSTGWALQLAATVGAADSARAQRARLRLLEHMRADCGFSTYAAETEIRRFIGAPVSLPFHGWCGSHTCVTAAVAQLAQVRSPACVFLRATQRTDGSWVSYWWCEPEYATALAAAALRLAGTPADCERAQRATDWAARRLGARGWVATDELPAGSPYATAWCLATLLDAGSALRPARQALGWLLQQQRSDGSWQPSARMRLPLPDDCSPESSTGWVRQGRIQGSIVLDQLAVFTTATVLRALLHARNAEV